MRKRLKSVVVALAVGIMTIGTMTVQASSMALLAENNNEFVAAANVDVSNFNVLDVETGTESVDIDVETSFCLDEEKEALDISNELNRRASYVLPDNPRAVVTGDLTANDSMDLYFFSASASKYLFAQLTSDNANYVSRLYMVNYETGQAALTNIGGMAGDTFGINGLPAGDYALSVETSNGSVGDSYKLSFNAANPSGNITSAMSVTADFRMVLVYENGDVYGDGTYIYNTSNMNQPNEQMNWERNDEFTWGSGYTNRDHSVYNVLIKDIAGPVSWSSQHATSDNVMLVYCNVGTCFMYMESAYQSGTDPSYYRSFVDTFGKTTPRVLEDDDFEMFDHILAYDLNTGKVIDFYSPLNYFYASGAESQPVIGFH